jgi:hypothetical protein
VRAFENELDALSSEAPEVRTFERRSKVVERH